MNQVLIAATANMNRFYTMFRFDFNFHLPVLDIFKLLHKRNQRPAAEKPNAENGKKKKRKTKDKKPIYL